jgi:mono/diheme cytochrome c family protein
MTRALKTLAVVVLAVAVLVAGLLFAFLRRGVSARAEPWAAEEWVARRLRGLAIPADARKLGSPLAVTPETLAEGRAEFANHCASCHANDGSGTTDLGQGLYPKAPDMRQQATQGLSDGEMFYIIRNGIRFTGMPAWGLVPGEREHETWALVHFIRHLPQVTPEELLEMAELNPRSLRETPGRSTGRPD